MASPVLQQRRAKPGQVSGTFGKMWVGGGSGEEIPIHVCVHACVHVCVHVPFGVVAWIV